MQTHGAIRLTAALYGDRVLPMSRQSREPRHGSVARASCAPLVARPPNTADSVVRQPTPSSEAEAGDTPSAGSAATTRDTMGLTTPSPLAFEAGHNRFSHDLRQLGQLVQLLSYTPRPRGLVLHSIRIGTYPLPPPAGAGQAVQRDVMCPREPRLHMRP